MSPKAFGSPPSKCADLRSSGRPAKRWHHWPADLTSNPHIAAKACFRDAIPQRTGGEKEESSRADKAILPEVRRSKCSTQEDSGDHIPSGPTALIAHRLFHQTRRIHLGRLIQSSSRCRSIPAHGNPYASPFVDRQFRLDTRRADQDEPLRS